MLKPELLTGNHDRKTFDCGNPDLNRWLREQALPAQKKGVSRTFVAVMAKEPSTIVGFHALNAAEVLFPQLPNNISQKMPNCIPVSRLGRLAVSANMQGQGLGEILLADAIERARRAAEHVGSVGLVVEAKNINFLGFYRKFGFLDCLDKPLRLFLPFEGL